jgi:hypothetical protein
MKQSTLRLASFTLFLISAFISQAQNTINVVTTAVPFLRISPDARAGGMGEVGIATAPDANSSFWNLAKTSFNTSPGAIGLTYTPWLKRLGLNDVYLATVAGYYKLDEQQAIAGSLRYFSLGDIQFTNGNGDPLNTYRPREFSFDMGYTRKLSDNIGLGVALRYINSSLAKGDPGNTGTTYKAGSSVAGDISFFYHGATEEAGGWNFGAVMSNLGTKIGYTSDATQKDYIPANLGLGTAYTKVFDTENKITFGLDLNKLLVPTPPLDSAGFFSQQALVAYRNKSVVSSWFSSLGDAPGGFKEELKEVQASIGMEYSYMDQFAVRAGYFYEDKTKGNRQYFTLGAGLKYQVFGLNFSYIVPSGSGINQNPLSNTLRFSLIFDLNGENTGGGGEGGDSE